MRFNGSFGSRFRPKFNTFKTMQELKKMEEKNRASQEAYDLKKSIEDGSYRAACDEQSRKNRENFDAMMKTIQK